MAPAPSLHTAGVGINQIESHLHKARRVHLGECDPQEVMTELGPEMEELTRE